MKVLSRFSLLLAVASLIGAGCSKTSVGTDQPDISNFAVSSATPLVPGEPVTVHVISTTLNNETYTIEYSLSGSNQAVGLTAPLTMSNKNGDISTIKLTYSGLTSVTLNSIKNSKGKITYFTNNNVANFYSAAHDSTGYMKALINGNLAFLAYDVNAGLDNRKLTIHGTDWDPQITSIYMTLNEFWYKPGTFNFWVADSSTNVGGVATYTAPGEESKTVSHGTVIISDVLPIIKGKYTFTMPDSMQITGNFEAKAP